MMKTTLKYFSLVLIAIGFISPAFAQQNNRRSGGNQSRNNISRQNNNFRQNNSTRIQQNRTPSVRQNNSFSRQYRTVPSNRVRENNYGTANRGGRVNSPINSRNRISNNNSFYRNNNQRYVPTNRNRNIISYRTNYSPRYLNTQRNHFSRFGYAPRRYSYFGYQRFSVLPRTSISIHFGGYPYYYNNGLFYGYYNGFYEPVYAPFGIRVRRLPIGYYSFNVGPNPYYYYDGTYYRADENSQYEVVDAPMGAVVTSLPKGATVATVNGEKFYEFNGTYYKEGTNSNNEIVYTVVGKYGEINNTDEQEMEMENDVEQRSSNTQNNDNDTEQPLQIGDHVITLPLNSQKVTIDGQVLYLSPDNLYFKEKIIDKKTWYEVVGSGEVE